MNRITQKEFNETKNALIGVISFNGQTQKRELAYGNLSYIHAVKHMISEQKKGLICVLVDKDQFDQMVKFEYNTKTGRISLNDMMSIINPKMEIVN